MKKIIAIISFIPVLFLGCNKTNSPKLVTHNYTKQQWIGGIMNAVGGLKLHLNNFTSAKNQYMQGDTYAFENPTSSSVTLNGITTPFDIAVTRQDPYSVYINDVNSSKITGDAHDALAFIIINFESDGVEIFGNCVNNVICVCGDIRLDLSNLVATIPLALGVKDGTVNLEAQNSTFTSDISETGPCVNNVCAFACDIFAPNKNSDMQIAIAKAMEDYVNQNAGLLSSALNQYLKTLGVSGPIVSAQIAANGDLAVEDRE